jgi:hypothetical protein
MFDEWRGEMHTKEDRSKTLLAFVELAKTLVYIILFMYSLFPLPEVDQHFFIRTFILATYLYRNRTRQLSPV